MHYDPIAEPKDTRPPIRYECHSSPDIGKATYHLEGLRKHLLALGHPLEAAAVATALDLLIPTRVCSRRMLP